MTIEPPSDSPEVSITRLAFELGELHARLSAVPEASRARTAELRQINQQLRERLGLDKEGRMNICYVCQADGVLNALGHWYCMEHLEQGLIDVAAFIARARQWDPTETTEQLQSWLAQ